MNAQEKEKRSCKEQKILDLLRDEKYYSIKVIKNKDGIALIEGLEKIKDQLTVNKILQQHNYQNIEIIQSKGKIVHINRTVRIKL